MKLSKKQAAESEARTVDYTRRSWGHDYSITQVIDGGQELKACGWGPFIGRRMTAGDYVLLQGKQPGSSTRYQVAEIRYCSDPADMWFAALRFAPRGPIAQAAGEGQ